MIEDETNINEQHDWEKENINELEKMRLILMNFITRDRMIEGETNINEQHDWEKENRKRQQNKLVFIIKLE